MTHVRCADAEVNQRTGSAQSDQICGRVPRGVVCRQRRVRVPAVTPAILHTPPACSHNTQHRALTSMHIRSYPQPRRGVPARARCRAHARHARRARARRAHARARPCCCRPRVRA